jgi:uncharacterized protein (TIGR00251 family)
LTRSSATSVPLPGWIRAGSGYLTVEIAARPGAPSNRFVRIDERGLVVAIAAPPERGKANDELCRFLAKIAHVPRSSVSILKGESARRKTVRIETLDPGTCASMMLELGAELDTDQGATKAK